MVLEMPFFTFNNANIKFAQKKFIRKSYIAAKALLTTKRIEIINKKEFTKATLDKNVKTFVIHVKSLSLTLILIYLAQEVQIALLVLKKL